MSIDIPSEVVLFLNLLGLPYPDIDAEQVRELGRYVEEFAADVRDTHEAATGAVNDMGSVYSGYSYEALLTSWGRMSAGNMAQLDNACELVSTTLSVAADVVEAVQVAVLVELAALAAIYLGMLLTPGGIVTSQFVAIGARRLLAGLQQMLMWYFAAEVLAKAIEPFEETIEQIVSGMLYDTVSDVLDAPQDTKQSLYIEPEEVRRYAGVIEAHADTMLNHADKFTERAAQLNFETPGLDLTIADGPIEPGGPVDPIVAPTRFGLQGLEHLLPPSVHPADLSPGAQPPLTELTRTDSPPQAAGPAAAQNGDHGIRPPGAVDPNSAPPGPPGPPGPLGSAAAPEGTTDSTSPGRPATEAGSPGSSAPAVDPAGAGHSPADSRPAATGSAVSPAAESAAGMRGAGEGAGPVAGAPGQTPTAGQAPVAGQAPAGQRAADPAGRAPGGAGRTSDTAGRTPARARTEQQQPSAGRESLRTPWSRRGRTVDRPTPVAPAKPATVSVGDNGDRPPVPGTHRSQDEQARETNPRVVAPETTAPEPETTDGKPPGRAEDRDQQRDLPAEPVPAPASQPDRPAGRE